MSSLDQYLAQVYYDPAQGLQDAAKLYTKIKRDPRAPANITLRQVREFINNQELTQRTHKRKISTYYPIRATQGPFTRMQIDFLDVRNLGSKINGNTNYILCLVDIYSRYAFAVPTKSRDINESVRAMKQVLTEIEQQQIIIPAGAELMSDNEPAWKGRAFEQVLAPYGLQHTFVPPNDYKAKAIVERFNRTLRGFIMRYQVAYGGKYIDALPKLMQNYNSTVHRTLRATPKQVIGWSQSSNKVDIDHFDEKYEDRLMSQTLKAANASYVRGDPAIHIGDTVFIKATKQYFKVAGIQPRNGKTTVYQVRKTPTSAILNETFESNQVIKIGENLPVGARVRVLLKKKNIFVKEGKSWSQKIYTIINKTNTRGLPQYYVDDKAGKPLRRAELMRVDEQKLQTNPYLNRNAANYVPLIEVRRENKKRRIDQMRAREDLNENNVVDIPEAGRAGRYPRGRNAAPRQQAQHYVPLTRAQQRQLEQALRRSQVEQ